MKSSWYTFVILFANLLVGDAVNSNSTWCVPKVVTYKQCNKCWCMGDGIPVCTKLPCDILPGNFWEKAQTKPTSLKRVRSYGIFDPIRNYISSLIAQTADELGPIIKDKVAEYLNTVFKERIEATLKEQAKKFSPTNVLNSISQLLRE